MTTPLIVNNYLDLLDSQREAAFTALEGLSEAQIWQRPTPKEWCIGEMLNHNLLLIASSLPLVRAAWGACHRLGERKRSKPYKIDIADPYRKPKFPQWVGFLWSPRHTPTKPVTLGVLKEELRDLHEEVREFYSGKPEDVLGHVYLYDPLFGFVNLIVTLRIGIYHDQLHYEDVGKLAVRLLR